jgi:hypothetical protein
MYNRIKGTGGNLTLTLSRLHTVAYINKLFATVDADALLLLTKFLFHFICTNISFEYGSLNTWCWPKNSGAKGQSEILSVLGGRAGLLRSSMSFTSSSGKVTKNYVFFLYILALK